MRLSLQLAAERPSSDIAEPPVERSLTSQFVAADKASSATQGGDEDEDGGQHIGCGGGSVLPRGTKEVPITPLTGSLSSLSKTAAKLLHCTSRVLEWMSRNEEHLRPLVELVVTSVYELMHCQRVTLYFVDHAKKELWIALAKDKVVARSCSLMAAAATM